MPRKPIGDQAVSGAERSRRWRERLRQEQGFEARKEIERLRAAAKAEPSSSQELIEAQRENDELRKELAKTKRENDKLRQHVRDLEELVRARAAKPKVAKPPVTQWKQDRDRARRRAR